MKGDRIPHGLHPDWCDLSADCGDPGRDPRHTGMASAAYPWGDDVRIEVELVRQDDVAPAATIVGDTKICLRLTNSASCNLDGTPTTADTYLSHGDALALAHTLTTYAKRLKRRDGNYPPADLGQVSPIGDSEKVAR